MRTLYLKLLRLLQSRCQHPDYAVKADILEGDWVFGQIHWCEICGAWRIESTNIHSHSFTEWREPRPDWYTPKERKEYLQAIEESK